MTNVNNVQQQQHGGQPPSYPEGFMEKFRLYETRSKFYMVGRDKGRTFWKILIIDRSEPSELNIREDSAVYTERQCSDLLRRIHEGNRVTGGLKFVTTCYGIVGFIKFLGPYYMLLITRRRQIGAICGHNVYAIAKNEIIPVPNSPVNYSMVNQKENRYKKLLGMVDLTKDFYFSYSYNVMWSLQKNMCDNENGLLVYETMFVWNEYLTRGIRNILQNTLWTVALVYGFFKQATLSISGKDLNLTLIARRSRHYAGTRYLKRGVNEEGSVANDVETEQILIEDVPERLPMQVSSVVQIRGSIPLFWSQETSRLNLKPDIILSKRDRTYEATRLHFENLVQRYGNPIIILNLIKTNEKKPRESILRSEFANAIEFLNKDLPEENRLKFLHWDLNKHSRSKATDVLLLLGKVAAYALTLTGFFYSQAVPDRVSEGQLSLVNCLSHGMPNSPCSHLDNQKQNHGDDADSENPDRNSSGGDTIRPPMVQNGVLRTNCIDCLDRTNVAQYAYGLAALGNQLRALGVLTSTRMDLDDPLAEELMGFYEKMGDTLAHQYGGSAAHNKIFSKRRGKWNAATQSQEFFRTLQRYYSNAYMDAEKQNAINVFLGHFEPQLGKPDVWELDSDQHHIVAGNEQSFDANESTVTRVINIFLEAKQRLGVPEWFPFKRSWSEGNILRGTYLADESNGGSKMHYESTPEIQISTPASETPSSSYASPMPARELFAELQRDGCFKTENADAVDWSNFVDIDWLSSSGNSFEDELFESLTRTASPAATLSSENVVSDEKTPSTSEYGPSSRGRDNIGSDTSMSINEAHNDEVVLDKYSASFMQWVTNGEALCL